MTIQYQLTKVDFMRFSAAHARFRPAWFKGFYHGFVLPVFLAALAIATDFVTAAVFMLSFVVINWLLYQWYSRLYCRAVFSDDNFSAQSLPRTATILESGLRVENEAGYIFYHWRFIRRVSRTDFYICFTVTPIECQHIPVAAFHDETHLQEFFTLANLRVKQLSQFNT